MERLSRVGDWIRHSVGSGISQIAAAIGAAYRRVRRSSPASAASTGPAPASKNNFIPADLPDTGPSEPQTIEALEEESALKDGQRIYAIGDIHGRADLLENLLTQIEEDCEDFAGDVSIIFLGDYIDRGFQSRQVIETILSGRLSVFDVYCLKGNHEEAMLQFLADPDFGPRWASYGGRETLVSYGIRPPRSQTRREDWQETHAALIEALPMEHENFLMRLLPSVRIGKFGFVHAGVRPGVPFDEQSERDLLWIRDEFLNSPGAHDVFVVHGHTPVDQPFWDNRRINVDTGAYISGRLTAVRLEHNTVAFLSTKI